MSCERVQEKFVEVLASREAALDRKLASHVRACASCREFYEAQRHLFSVIDSGVKVMVSEAMPASLLPGVRARMEAVEVARAWPDWLAPSAAVIVLALVTIVPLTGWHSQTTRPETLNREVAAVSGQDALKLSKPVVRSVRPPQRRLRTMKSFSKAEEVPQEAILSAEQAAVARFASAHPEEMAEVVRAAGSQSTDLSKPIEIALIEIENIELAPLAIETED